MTRLLLIRHGQSEANIEGRFAGHTDAPLSELGKNQAKETAAYIVSAYQVDAVYASDLQRAFMTGKAVADLLNQTVTPTEALREIYAGRWENMPYGQLAKEEESYQVWLHDIGRAACSQGESTKELQQRVVGCLSEIAQAHPGQTVVVATHATPVRVAQCYCEGKPIEELKDIPWVSNASVTELRYEDGSFTLQEAGHDAHLGALKSHLPKNV